MGKRVLFMAAGFVAGVAATLYLGHVLAVHAQLSGRGVSVVQN